MQRVSAALGSFRTTYKAIGGVEKQRATPGGAASHNQRTFGRFFQTTGRMKPEEIDFSGLAKIAEEAQPPRARRTSLMNHPNLAGELNRVNDVRDFQSKAREACPIEMKPIIPLAVRRS